MTATSGAPRQIGRYLVDGVPGRGAMGTVYLATDPHIQRQVALKTINPELLRDSQQESSAADAGTARALYQRGARAGGSCTRISSVCSTMARPTASRLSHSNMRAEKTLAARLAKEACLHGTRLPLVRTLAWFAQLLDALAYAHEAGVIHRDIKPANLLIAPRGECKIADFGIAQLDTGRLTQIGVMIGTPAYMSPEQYTGAPIDARSDLFSAGVVLYEMLTGKCPFSGSSAAVMQQVLNGMPPAPSSETPAFPPRSMRWCARRLQRARGTLPVRAKLARGVAEPAGYARGRTRSGPDGGRGAGESRGACTTAFTEGRHRYCSRGIRRFYRLASRIAGAARRAARAPRWARLRRCSCGGRRHTQRNPRMLAAQLARHLPDEATRHQFDTLLQRHTCRAGKRVFAAGERAFSLRHASLPPRHACPMPRISKQPHGSLQRILGPSPRIVAQRAALGVDTATFHNRLADALPATVDRTAFSSGAERAAC